MAEHSNTSGRGFASMDGDKQRDIARKGGESVPNEKRSFSQDRRLAADAGRKGGESVPHEKRSFSMNRELAAAASHKGGAASHGGAKKTSSARSKSDALTKELDRSADSSRKGSAH